MKKEFIRKRNRKPAAASVATAVAAAAHSVSSHSLDIPLYHRKEALVSKSLPLHYQQQSSWLSDDPKGIPIPMIPNASSSTLHWSPSNSSLASSQAVSYNSPFLLANSNDRLGFSAPHSSLNSAIPIDTMVGSAPTVPKNLDMGTLFDTLAGLQVAQDDLPSENWELGDGFIGF
jgi:hypothetical protein